MAGTGSQIAIVTDSTAYLPEDLVARHGITVVPLKVVIRDNALTEGVEVTPQVVADALRRRVPVHTSRPNPEEFATVYRAAAESGAQGVVSIHISGDLSGTVDAALLAAREAPVPVRVIDSRLTAMGLGYSVLAAAEAAAGGASLDEVAAAADKRASQTSVFFYVDTLEYLRRGGRIGAAQALLGSALAVKPLLHLVDGRVEPLEKVRTSAKAATRLVELVTERAGRAAVDLAVHHLANADRAEELAARLRARLPHAGPVYVTEVGAVVGAHMGPGTLGAVVSLR
jgi:DegV family protein with EDD domain